MVFLKIFANRRYRMSGRWPCHMIISVFFLVLLLNFNVSAQNPSTGENPITEISREQVLLRYFHPIDILGRARTDSILQALSGIERSIPTIRTSTTEWSENEAVSSARIQISNGNFRLAQSILDAALKKGDPHPEVPFLLSQILITEGSPGGRQKAEEMINEALRRSPGNINYRLARARIYTMRTLEGYAERELDRILRDVPTLAEAYAIKGQFKVERLTGAGWKKAGWAADIKRQWIESERNLALEYLATAIALDSLNTRAHHWLAHLYLHEENWTGAMRVLNRMVGFGLETDMAQLGQGISLFNLQLYEDTKRVFDSAYVQMEPEARELMFSTVWVTPVSDASKMMQGGVINSDMAVQASIDSIFWTGHDLLLSDDINHRVLEQARRFAHVAWFFELPALGLAGWETLAGQIYLRYGEPRGRNTLTISRFQHTTGFEIERIGALSNRPGGTNLGQTPPFPSQWWNYGDFGIPLGVGFITGNMDFITQEAPGPGSERPFEFIDNDQLYFEFIERQPDLSTIAGYESPSILEYRTYEFPANDSGTEIVGVMKVDDELASDLIRGRRSFQQDPVLHAIALDLRSGEMVQAEVPVLEVNRSWSTLPYYSRKFLLVAPPVKIQSGRYLLSIELTSGTGRSWVSKDSVDVKESDSGLKLSDIVLANAAEREPVRRGWPSAGTLNRYGWRVVPRISDTFNTREPKILYAEYTGLQKDEYGATQYTVELTIGRRQRRGLVEFTAELIRGITGRRSGQEQITLSWERSGISSNGAEVLNIVIPEPSNNEYVITFRIIDQIAERTVEARTVLIISEWR